MSVAIAAIGQQRPPVIEALSRDFDLHEVWTAPDKVAALQPVASQIRGVVSNGMTGLPTKIIEALPNLEICAIFGVGLETTDLALARDRGITVTTAPVLHEDVADLAVLLAMGACRRIVEADKFVRTGKWTGARMDYGRKFSGKRAGIAGLGRIGAAVADRLQGFGLKIQYYDPLPKSDVPYAAFDSLVALAEGSDILFLTAAGSHGAGPIVTAETIAALGPEGVFVNVSRGWLVDEAALVAALVNGRLAAAGLDVFQDEPNVPPALLALDNVVLSPHIASNTKETMAAMGDCVLDNIRSWFAGKGALNPV